MIIICGSWLTSFHLSRGQHSCVGAVADGITLEPRTTIKDRGQHDDVLVGGGQGDVSQVTEKRGAIADMLAGARNGGIAFPRPSDEGMGYFSGLVVRAGAEGVWCFCAASERWAGTWPALQMARMEVV